MMIEYGRTDVDVSTPCGDRLAQNVPHEVRAHESSGHLEAPDQRYDGLVEVARFQHREDDS